jgi:hypothetical protein
VIAGPAGLIGDWLVEGTSEPAGTVVGIGVPTGPGDTDPSLLVLWRPCTSSAGGWKADWNGLFVANTIGTNSRCPRPADQSTPRWLSQANGYRVDGSNRLLLDSAGRVLARLLPSSPPAHVPAGAVGSWNTEVPSPSSAVQAQFTRSAPLPKGLLPASRARVVGRWVPIGFGSTPLARQPYLAFRADGTWESSDGCNGNRGPWAIGRGGAMLAVVGISGAVGCAGASTDSWMEAVAHAGLDGRVLVLVDRNSKALGRLTRS